MATVIDSYNGEGVSLGTYINDILRANTEIGDVPNAPHKDFWDTMTYTDFTTGNVPHVNSQPPPAPPGPYPILVVGDGANSNFVLALQGRGPLFNNADGAFGQMPADANPPSKPYFTHDQIQPIIDWIDRKCPNPGGR
jgi:hypothetical protein